MEPRTTPRAELEWFSCTKAAGSPARGKRARLGRLEEPAAPVAPHHGLDDRQPGKTLHRTDAKRRHPFSASRRT